MKRLLFSIHYLMNPPWDTGISPPELEEFIRVHLPGRALDLGCGTGTNAITLARAGWQVTAVDFISRAIRTARKKASRAGVNIDFRVQDVTRLDNLDGPVDLILDIGCFHSLPVQSKLKYQDHIARLLAPDGVFLLYALLKEQDDGNPGLTPTDLEALNSRLSLLVRQDGLDRNIRPSAWFTYSHHGNRESLRAAAK